VCTLAILEQHNHKKITTHKLRIYPGNPNRKTNVLLASSRLFIIQQWASYRLYGSSLCSSVSYGKPLYIIHSQRTPFSLWGYMMYNVESIGRITGRSGVPNTSTYLQSASPSFVYLFVFSPN
jgi:hypothetical protein